MDSAQRVARKEKMIESKCLDNFKDSVSNILKIDIDGMSYLQILELLSEKWNKDLANLKNDEWQLRLLKRELEHCNNPLREQQIQREVQNLICKYKKEQI